MTSETRVQHTPGPWRIEDAEDAYGNLTLSQDNGEEHGEDCIATVYVSEEHESEANARLIAADLLAALQLCIDVMEEAGVEHNDDDEAFVREAIRKATGEE